MKYCSNIIRLINIGENDDRFTCYKVICCNDCSKRDECIIICTEHHLGDDCEYLIDEDEAIIKGILG